MLESTEKGGVRNSIQNCLTVFQHDPELSGAVAKNLLTERIDLLKPIGRKRRTGSKAMTDTDMKYIRLYKYYFIYSSELSHELCYAVSDSPCRSFVYGGTLVDNADLGLCDTARYFTGNNHGSIEQINGRWYVFYHRHTNSSMFCRQGMVEPIEILPDGRIPQVEITTSGPSGAPLPAVELRELPAYAACNLYMTQPPQVNAEAGQNPFPYITQDGADVMPESESKPEAYICNLTPGTVVGFKYLNFQNVTKVSVKTRGMCYYGGFDVLLTADGEPIGTVSAARGNEWTWQTTELAIPNGISAIYFRMKGYGTLSLAAAKFH